MRHEGAYTPTAQEGAPRRGDGSGPLSVGGLRPGGGKGSHTSVGRLRDGMGPRCRGAAAVPRARRSGVCHETPPPLPRPPPERTAAAGRADRAHRLTGEWLGWTPRRHEAPPHPLPRPACDLPWPPCGLPPAFFAHGTGTARTRTRPRPGARARARGRGPLHSPGTGDGTMASPCCDGGTPRPPWCSPPPTSAVRGSRHRLGQF